MVAGVVAVALDPGSLGGDRGGTGGVGVALAVGEEGGDVVGAQGGDELVTEQVGDGGGFGVWDGALGVAGGGGHGVGVDDGWFWVVAVGAVSEDAGEELAAQLADVAGVGPRRAGPGDRSQC